MYKTRFILLSALIIGTLFPVFSQADNNLIPDQHKKSLAEIVQRRKWFMDRFYLSSEMLQAYEDGQFYMKLSNLSDSPNTFSDPDLFYTWNRIEREIQIDPSDTEAEKSGKIFDFVQKSWKHMPPLYESPGPHFPPHFLSVYGSGICDDASHNVAYLAQHFGMESRTWWLNGHVVPMIYHDGDWRVYDADSIGIIRIDDQVASQNDWITLASQDAVKRFDPQAQKTKNYSSYVLSQEDNQIKSFNYSRIDSFGDPSLYFFARETEYYFKTPYLLTTDGIFLRQMKFTPEQFHANYQSMGNIIREIPVQSLMKDQSPIEIKSYFPISGLYVRLSTPPSEELLSRLPASLVQSEFLKHPGWLNGMPLKTPGLKHAYIDLGLGIKNLDLSPSYSVIINSLQSVLKHDPDARILLVHYFNPASLKLSEPLTAKLGASHIQTEFRS